MLTVFLQAKLFPLEFVSCILLALIPAVAWLWIFLGKHPEKKGPVSLAFFFGMLSAALVLAYQASWGDSFNFVYIKVESVNFQENVKGIVQHSLLASFCIFLSVGFMEEVAKHYAVVQADKNIFESVDDVIELSIVSALGFAFLENIGYFFMLVVHGQGDQLFATFLMRSIFVVFIHVLCSGIYGAFYGMGFFAKPYMSRKIQMGKTFYIAEFFHRIFHFRKAAVFHERMMIEGVVIASVLHGIYDFLLETNMTIFGKPLFMYGLPIYLVGGYWYLSSVLEKKENHERFGHLVVKEEYTEKEDEEEEKVPVRMKNAFETA
ncbi:MAG: PrsW family glutamic-type intramembrane protease [Candidatus Peregrinibacteria bacterium]